MQKTFSAYILTGVLAGLLIGVIVANVMSYDRLWCAIIGVGAGILLGAVVGLVNFIKDKKGR